MEENPVSTFNINVYLKIDARRLHRNILTWGRRVECFTEVLTGEVSYNLAGFRNTGSRVVLA